MQVIVNGIKYTLSQTHATVSGYTESIPECVVIPKEIEGIPVISIGFEAFWQCYNLKEITLPSGMTKIQNSAFSGCVALECVIIPDSVVEIGNLVFKDCASLKNIMIPNNVRSIGNYAFAFCKSLVHIIFPRNLAKICNGAFWGCTALKTMVIPDSVKEIKDNVFDNCISLTDVIISNGTKILGNHPFVNCPNLKAVAFPVFKKKITTRLFSKIDTAPKIYFEGTKEEFKNMFSFDIFEEHIAENEDDYAILTTVYCANGELIC